MSSGSSQHRANVRERSFEERFREWASEQKCMVECVYCILYVVGGGLAYRTNADGGQGNRHSSCAFSEASRDPTAPRNIAAEWFFLCQMVLHVVWICFISIALWKSKPKILANWRNRVFWFIRFLPLASSMVCWFLEKNADCNPMVEEGSVLWVAAYQLDWTYQIFFQLLECVVLLLVSEAMNIKDYMTSGLCHLALPLGVVYVLEQSMRKGFQNRTVEKGSPLEPHTEHAPPGPSLTKGEPSATVRPPQPVPNDVAAPCGSSSTAPRSVDISECFGKHPSVMQGREEGKAATLLNYKSMIVCKTSWVKANVPGQDHDLPEIQHDVYNRYQSIRRSQAARLEIQKLIVYKGCILFMFEDMSPAHGQDISQVHFTEKAAELIQALPEDMREVEMDIVTGGVKGHFVNGELVGSPENVEGERLIGVEEICVPEVLLVTEPCSNCESSFKMDLSLSQGVGDFEKMDIVMVIEEEVCSSKSIEQTNTRVTFDNVRPGRECMSGYFRTIGAEKDQGTLVSSMAPFLVLPKPAANELVGIFNNTVDEFRVNRPSEFQGTQYSQEVWSKWFKPFALDLHFLLCLTEEDVFKEEGRGELLTDFQNVFVHVAHFLKSAEAMSTLSALLQRFSSAGLELTFHGMPLIDHLSVLDGEEPVPTPVSSSPVQESTAHSAVSMLRNIVSSVSGKVFGGDSSSAQYQAMPGIATTSTSTVDASCKPPCGSAPPEHEPGNVERTVFGFKDPQLEAKYTMQLAENAVLLDAAGIVMTMCLLPLVLDFVFNGKALYLSPMLLHNLVCLVWLWTSGKIYVHNRGPVIFLQWLVRVTALTGRVSEHGLVGLAQASLWHLSAMGVWLVFIKPTVWKLPFQGHAVVCMGDLLCWIGVIGLQAMCGDFWSAMRSVGVGLGCLLASVFVVQKADESSRNQFVCNIQGGKP